MRTSVTIAIASFQHNKLSYFEQKTLASATQSKMTNFQYRQRSAN